MRRVTGAFAHCPDEQTKVGARGPQRPGGGSEGIPGAVWLPRRLLSPCLEIYRRRRLPVESAVPRRGGGNQAAQPWPLPTSYLCLLEDQYY